VAVSFQLTARPTDEDILELSKRNPGLQIEQLASGELILTPNGFNGSLRETELTAQLHQWARADGSGIATGPSTGFRLADGSLLCPDASWVRRERIEALTQAQREKFAPLCPDAVFEIRSPSNTLEELRAKMQTYLANGARLAVLIDPARRALEVYAPDRPPQITQSASSVSLDPVLPGFRLELGPIFG
jgi:Uma2 family endonuclease